MHQKVVDSIPDQGTYLGYRFSCQSGCIREVTGRFLSLSNQLKKSSGEDKIKLVEFCQIKSSERTLCFQ